jgi:hypothetical protein
MARKSLEASAAGRLDLSEDQVSAIEEATGVRVSHFDVLSGLGHAENAGEGKANAILLVACW